MLILSSSIFGDFYYYYKEDYCWDQNFIDENVDIGGSMLKNRFGERIRTSVSVQFFWIFF
jgi:hypothetical protein